MCNEKTPFIGKYTKVNAQAIKNQCNEHENLQKL